LRTLPNSLVLFANVNIEQVVLGKVPSATPHHSQKQQQCELSETAAGYKGQSTPWSARCACGGVEVLVFARHMLGSLRTVM
jgi:hypothetical protein